MKKYAGIISVGLIAMFIGIVLAMQISNASSSEQGGLVPILKLKDYEVALKQARAEREDALEELKDVESRLNAIEKETAAEDEIVKGLVSDTERYKMISGVTDVQGPGIVMTIDDPETADEYQEDISVITYNYELLLSVVNKLKEAGAEAIGINENRIVQTTEISLAGSHININGISTAPPYEIKAIGNPDTMHNTLTIRGGTVDILKKYDLKVSIVKKQTVKIPRYSGVITLKYATPISQK